VDRVPAPPLANDRDLEIEGCTSSLEPLKAFVRVDTEVFNNEPGGGPLPDPLPLLVGDWLNPSGELDTFTRAPGVNGPVTPAASGVGPPVASFLGTLGFFGYDEATGVDYAFTQVLPRRTRTGSFVFVSGVLCRPAARTALTLIGPTDPARCERRQQHLTAIRRRRRLASNAVDLENGAPDRHRTLQGCVRSPGPGRRARVSVGTNLFANAELASHFTTLPGPA
jgi:hypothetical protein